MSPKPMPKRTPSYVFVVPSPSPGAGDRLANRHPKLLSSSLAGLKKLHCPSFILPPAACEPF